MRRLVAAGELAPLLRADQLGVAQASGAAFAGFHEAPITFHPTYKCGSRSQLTYDLGEVDL